MLALPNGLDHPRLHHGGRTSQLRGRGCFHAIRNRCHAKSVAPPVMVLPPGPSRKPASTAVQQLWSEYAEWWMALEYPVSDNEKHDESWKPSSACDGAKEKVRLALVDATRLEQRRKDREVREQRLMNTLQQGAQWALNDRAR